MSAPSPAAPLVDGRYRLGEILGTGGAAVVRRAHDERLRRDVAVKLFHPGTADEERQSGELALMASLSHPALVRMYDGGRTSDANGAPSTYLVMEYVPGPTLRRALDGAVLSRAEVAGIGAGLASALGYLHGRGVVHRDVKPANVLLPPGEEMPAKLGDFGIARMLDGAGVTATGMTVGTANYLSPEQVRGSRVGPASDVYSLGLVLLEALTGELAYPGSGVAAALARLERPPVVPARLGPEWCSLLGAMLHTDPAARPDAGQVRRALAAVETAADADPAAATAALSSAAGTRPTGGTSLLPARHRAATSWPDAYLLEAPRRQRRMRPVTAFLLMGATAAAIVVGMLVASLSGGAANSPAAPLRTSTPPSTSPPVSPPVTRPVSAPSTPATSRAVAPVVTKVANTPAAAVPNGRGHGKAKKHGKHGG